MPDVTITVKDNGPYLVHGGASILDADGKEFDVKDKKTIALCRCGASGTQPFCNGTHRQIGFESEVRANQE